MPDIVYNIHMNTELMSSKEAAEKLGLSHDHVRRLLEHHQLKGKKIGRNWIVFDLNYQRKRKPKQSKKGAKNNERQKDY
jgi:excisionase family DNA binding protein